MRKTPDNNNRVEFINGILSEMIRVHRGWKSHKKMQFLKVRVYYNFVKPHQALDRKT